MQPADESAGMFWPVRAFFRDIVTDQIGGDAQSGLRPLPPHWVGLAITASDAAAKPRSKVLIAMRPRGSPRPARRHLCVTPTMQTEIAPHG